MKQKTNLKLLEIVKRNCNEILKLVQNDNSAQAQIHVNNNEISHEVAEPKDDTDLTSYRPNVLTTSKAAFTLAEVLITLAIIGVVAVLTVPALIQNYNAKAWETAQKVFTNRLRRYSPTALKSQHVR